MDSSAVTAAVDNAVDFANYFHTYGFLYHQKKMLSEPREMHVYCKAIFENKSHFLNKTVLNVGAGCGILAVWSAQAGANKVYAVEVTNMAVHARQVVESNNLQNVVEVIEGSIEDVDLPEKVDVIISNWMGHFLLGGSTFDSVIYARDRWLKPNGVLYPSHAQLWMAPITTGLAEEKMKEYQKTMVDWYENVSLMKECYGVHTSVLTKSFDIEQRKYYLETPLKRNLNLAQVIGNHVLVKEIDCFKASLDDLRAVHACFTSSITEKSVLCAFAGWFDVCFKGSDTNPAQWETILSTAPNHHLPTRWGQQVFILNSSPDLQEDDEIQVYFSMYRCEASHPSMEIDFSCAIKHLGQLHLPFQHKFFIG